MFTTVGGYQIKTGYDSCDTYELGDEVDWFIDGQHPGQGTLLDGVYEGYGEHGYAWVVIKDHVVHAIRPWRGFTPFSEDIDAFSESQDAFDAEFANLKPFERHWWTEAQWVSKEAADAERAAKYKKARERARCKLKHDHTLTCTLKEMYPQEMLSEVLYAEPPFLAMLPKRANFDGAPVATSRSDSPLPE